MASHITGVQRYLLEILERIPIDRSDFIAPRNRLEGVRAHVWEQAVLPLRASGKMLWSPSITGPLSVSKQVVTLHDVVPIDHPEWLNPRFAAWYQFLIPRIVQKVDRIITDSEFTKSRIIDLTSISQDKIQVIPLGVDAHFSPQSLEKRTQTCQQLKLPTDRYVLSLGSLEPRKNLGRLLRAWELIYNQLSEDIWLVISGAKGTKLVYKSVPELQSLPPRVFFTGHVADEHLPSLYSGALAFVYPSMYEGFGLPPLEAMACGTAVLVGNCASLPEVVGDAALLVDPYDVESIAEGLRSLVEDNALRSALEMKGLKQAAKFNWDRTAAETWRVLQNAADN
jgi:glycosyltransferase involved in cell wall biosynthesis